MFEITNNYCNKCTTTTKCKMYKYHTINKLSCCFCHKTDNINWIIEYDGKRRWMGYKPIRYYCKECYEFSPKIREKFKDMLKEDKGYRNMNILPKRFLNEFSELEYISYRENGND